MPQLKSYLVTGGAGFIGSNFVLSTRQRGQFRVVNLDGLTYAANPMNLQSLADDADYLFVHGDIGDRQLVAALLAEHQPVAVINFAAESHVDRSIKGPEEFIQTNVVGTFHLLEEVRRHWDQLTGEQNSSFRFLHVSTDEVYGSLGPADAPFRETTAYAPNSPYSASKAASDHLVRAYQHTYGLPTLTTNCSNNYGPMQYPEKLIPLVILNAVEGKPLPIYGDGQNVRDWLYVKDHCEALQLVLERGRVGEVYNIGGGCEKTNLEIVSQICALLDQRLPNSRCLPHAQLITMVKDRPGHDRRYAIDSSKLEQELGWKRRETFDTGLAKTVDWYLENADWVQGVRNGPLREWVRNQYAGFQSGGQ